MCETRLALSNSQVDSVNYVSFMILSDDVMQRDGKRYFTLSRLCSLVTF